MQPKNDEKEKQKDEGIRLGLICPGKSKKKKRRKKKKPIDKIAHGLYNKKDD